MPPTLADLRSLLDLALTHTANPALLREPEANRSVVGLASIYLGEDVARELQMDRDRAVAEVLWRSSQTRQGHARITLTALALAKGYDPGPAALGVSLTRSSMLSATGGWWLSTDDEDCWLDIAEPDPVAALVLAVAHVLEVPRAHP